MKHFFKELFEYNNHMNQKLWHAFYAGADMTSEKAVLLYNHIINAHQIWNRRIEGKSMAAGVWELHALQDLKRIDEENFENSLQILHRSELDQNVNYQNSKGQAFSKMVRDIFFHVINHSTYHRGQIASEMKQHGVEPLSTDYIFFKQ